MNILTIAHTIFLTREQRYSIEKKNELEVIGISLPVWMINGITTEPAKEVICKYTITNNEKNETIQTNKDGYTINLPQKPKNLTSPSLSDDIWRSLTREERRKWYQNNLVTYYSGDNLKDVDDGGSCFLQFKEHNKIYKDGNKLEIIHFIIIRSILEL